MRRLFWLLSHNDWNIQVDDFLQGFTTVVQEHSFCCNSTVLLHYFNTISYLLNCWDIGKSISIDKYKPAFNKSITPIFYDIELWHRISIFATWILFLIQFLIFSNAIHSIFINIYIYIYIYIYLVNHGIIMISLFSRLFFYRSYLWYLFYLVVVFHCNYGVLLYYIVYNFTWIDFGDFW